MMRIRMKLALALVVCCEFSAACLGAPADNQEEAAKYAEAGQKAMASGHYAEARQNFEQLAKLEPNIAEVHATLAAIYFKLREYELSVREVRTAQKLKPSLPRLDSLLGLSLAELGQFDEALPLLEKGFQPDGRPEIRRMCGLQLLRAYHRARAAMPMRSKLHWRSTSCIPMTLKFCITRAESLGSSPTRDDKAER